MKRIFLMVVVAFLAALVAVPNTVEAHRRRGRCVLPTREQILQYIDYDASPLGFDVQFLGPRKGMLGLTELHNRRIMLFRRCGQSPQFAANILTHEVGHAVDYRYMTGEERNQFMQMRGYSRPWYPNCRCSDYRFGAGDFAEVFAWFHSPRVRFASRIAPAPREEHREWFEPMWRD